jgi:hypothetical protein
LWVPDRSPVRSRLKRLPKTEDRSLDFVWISDALALVAGDSGRPDAFVEFSGEAVASTRVLVARLKEGLSGVPMVVPLAAPLSLVGRVQNAALQAIGGAEVELYESLLDRARDGPGLDATHVLRASTLSRDDGSFVFDRLEADRYQIVATAPDSSRALVDVRIPVDLAVLTVADPVRAVGRVLHNHVPEPGARVRFVPTVDAALANTDAADLGLAEATTDDGGVFVVAVPRTVGELQVISAGGASIRLPIAPDSRSRQIIVGDVELPDRHRFSVRFLDRGGCDIWAFGPLDKLGLTVVAGTPDGAELTSFEVPEAGEWILEVQCGGRSVPVRPSSVGVPLARPAQSIDLRAR